MGHAAGTDSDEAAGSMKQGLSAGSPPDDRPPSGPGTPSVTLDPIFPDEGLVVMANLEQEITNFLIESDRADNEESKQSQRDLNPCRHLERVVS
jgi:hypothetical protein